jgi:hypothetical protein
MLPTDYTACLAFIMALDAVTAMLVQGMYPEPKAMLN